MRGGCPQAHGDPSPGGLGPGEGVGVRSVDDEEGVGVVLEVRGVDVDEGDGVAVAGVDDGVAVDAGDAVGEVGGVDDVESVDVAGDRSEEHTSELQSLMRISYAVFCLKKKTKPQYSC